MARITASGEICEGCNTYPVYLVKTHQLPRCRKCSSSVPKVRRLFLKNGKPLLYSVRRPWTAIIYVHDLANTLIRGDWMWTFLALSAAFLFTWLAFAFIWMTVCANNDLEDTRPCLKGVQSFAGYLLFSIETQTSIGYGNRYITHHCPEAVLVLCIQIMAGCFVCGLLVSIVYEKIAKPDRYHWQNFSKKATICLRDGKLCLVFRIRDTNHRFQSQNQIKVFLVEKKEDDFRLKSVRIERVGILIWPLDIVHTISATSPFWDLSARDLVLKSFELIVVMEGTSLTTSISSTATTSYLSREILWGHIFQPCVTYNTEEHCYVINHGSFNKTKEVPTPLCSAKRLYEVCEELSSGFSSIPSYVTSAGNSNNLTPIIIHTPIAEVTEDESDSECCCDENEPLFVRLKQFLNKYHETSL